MKTRAGSRPAGPRDLGSSEPGPIASFGATASSARETALAGRTGTSAVAKSLSSLVAAGAPGVGMKILLSHLAAQREGISTAADQHRWPLRCAGRTLNLPRPLML